MAQRIIPKKSYEQAEADIARMIHAAVYPEEPWEDCPGMHKDHKKLAHDIMVYLAEQR